VTAELLRTETRHDESNRRLSQGCGRAWKRDYSATRQSGLCRESVTWI